MAEPELAANRDTEFMQAKAATARFYADHILRALRDSIVGRHQGIVAMACYAF